MWDLQDDRKLYSFGGKEYWSGVVMSADGRRALTRDSYGRVRLWDVQRGKELCHRPDNVSEACCVALSPDGRLALAGYHNVVILYDVLSGQMDKMLREDHGRVLAVAFSPDSSRFAYGDEHGLLHLRQTQTKKELWRPQSAHPGPIRALVFSLDGKRLYSGGGRSPKGKPSLEVGAIRVWDAATGKPARPLRGHTEEVQALALSSDGTQLLSGAGGAAIKDCTVRLWDTDSGKELKPFDGHNRPVTSVAFAPDRKWFASASHAQTFLWDLESTSTKPARVLTVQGTRALSFVGKQQVVTAENDRQLVVCGVDREPFSGGFLPHLVNGLALSADRTHLLTANRNGTVYILRLPLQRR
jgi:WD40 repeat protein